uniref:Uncharacterized protein n=1 Tax=Octopus bimaculoides TaxID=37653 RepID=A0A0L8H3C7_OCTBM
MTIILFYKIRNEEFLRLIGLSPVMEILIERNLLWVGHVHGMDNNRLTRRILYSQLSKGKINHGRPRLKFKGTAKKEHEVVRN